jgi:general stress protein 26
MNKKLELEKLESLLQSQRFAVLASQGEIEPYQNLIAFINTKDLKQIIFATSKNTKKYDNIIKNSKISILIDNRGNKPDDIKKAVVVTVVGIANELKHNLDLYKNLFLKKHPYLADFINLPDTVLINLKVEKYLLVDHFENFKVIKKNI